MQFNSYEFILLLLPVTVILYFIGNRVNSTIGKIILITSSVLFYSLGRVNMLVYLLVSVAINYGSVIAIKKFSIKAKALMSFPVIVNVVLLLYFKYTDFAITNVNLFFGTNYPLQNIVLPLGISFYTFQQIAYVVASESGELPNTNLFDYLAYILYFPKLIMGPLIEPRDFITQINQEDRKRINATNISIGIKLFSLGLLKKVLLADTFSQAVSWVYNNFSSATAMDCILLMLFYTFEIYFDFSGYSDMSVGISAMFNIDLPINFDSPYKAVSIRDFWKRWHISLTRFLTKYIFIPLGGSKKGVIFTYVNTMMVFLVSGLWHGSKWAFVLWGLLHGLFSCFDRRFEKLQEKVFLPLRWFCTFTVVNILWLLFSTQSITQWKSILVKIVEMQSTAISSGLIATFNIPESRFLSDVLHLNYFAEKIRGFNMLIFIIASCLICFAFENNYKNKNRLNIRTMLMAAIAFIWGFLCLGVESTFVYYGF